MIRRRSKRLAAEDFASSVLSIVARARFLDNPMAQERGLYGDDTAQKIDSEVRRLVKTGEELPRTGQPFDLYGHYSIGDARFDLSDAPVETVTERKDGLTFRLNGGARLVVTWLPKIEGDLV